MECQVRTGNVKNDKVRTGQLRMMGPVMRGQVRTGQDEIVPANLFFRRFCLVDLVVSLTI